MLRRRLPAHMLPAYLERLDLIPLSRSGKVDRTQLPAPTSERCGLSAQPYAKPTTYLEQQLALTLAEVLRVERVSVDSHFFTDLGANSLLVAHFCAQFRERAGLPSVGTKDVYLHPTIRSLAAALARPAAAAVQPVPAAGIYGHARTARVSTAQYLLCGAVRSC